jgi:DNA-binding transcriptional LysR family regulator
MNIHHLELFYYVARHGGIAEAVRKMPYGIQQPAISVQLIQLEKSLGTTLFRRRPFELTKAGRELFAFADPFFSGTDEIAARIRGESDVRIRIGASQTILRDYLPKVLSIVRRKVPNLRVALREGYPHELLQAVDENEIDVAISAMETRPPAGMRKTVVAKLHPSLLLPATAAMRDQDLAACAARQDPLIALPPGEPVCRLFQQELKRRHIDWTPTIEVSALDLVAAYVKEGFGVGLSVTDPNLSCPGVKTLLLDDFPAITIAAVWRKLLSPAAKYFVEALSAEASALRL